jgi:creatinine amidohydrolase
MNIEDMTMSEFKKGLKKTKTLIVPFGTVEAHGGHLPLNTDSLIIREVAKRVAEDMPVFVGPCVPFGVCTSTGPHPGTISITPETLRRLISDIVRESAKKGIRGFILVSGHGGGLHVSAMREAGEALIQEIKGINMATLSIYEIIKKEASSIAETKDDSHAGEIETSLVLFLAPRLVKGRAEKGHPKPARPFIARDKMRFWKGAVWGDPSKASRAKGEAMFNAMVGALKKLARDIQRLR